MNNCEQKTLAKYLIALGIVDFLRIYYGMGLIAKLIFIILENNKNVFEIALFVSNLVIYLCFLGVFILFYKKIIAFDDRDIRGLFFMWTAVFVLLPLINLLGLCILEQNACQTGIMSEEFNYATGWTTSMLIIAVHIICMILTACHFRQLRYGIAALLLGIIYFIGWQNAQLTLSSDITIYNNIKLGTVLLTGLMLFDPIRRNKQKIL